MLMTKRFIPCQVFVIWVSACSAADQGVISVADSKYLPDEGTNGPKEAYRQLCDAMGANDTTAYAALLATDPKYPSEATPSRETYEIIKRFRYRDSAMTTSDQSSGLSERCGGARIALVHLKLSESDSNYGVLRLVFIEQNGLWKYHDSGMLGIDSGWNINTRTPKDALKSLQSAIKYHDWQSIFDMIDPRMRDGVDVRAFQAEVLRRWDELAAWEKQPKPPVDPRQPVQLDLPGELVPPQDPPVDRDQPISKEDRARLEEWNRKRISYGGRLQEARERAQNPPPYVVWSNLPGTNLKEISFSERGRRFVRLAWNDALGERRGETWVVRDGRWYWQPKKEYTLWPYLKYDDE